MRLVVLALALVVVGCGGSAESGTPYPTADHSWLVKLNRWQNDYEAADSRVIADYVYDGSQDVSGLRRELRSDLECARDLEADVGPPESRHLQRAYELFEEGCAESARWARAVVAAALNTELGGLPPLDALAKAERLFRNANDVIGSGLRANQELPTKEGPSSESRIEPRLSKAARTLAFRRVEVRCWSTRDWRPTVGEWNAYTGNDSDLAGFASGKSRVNIAPGYCGTIDRFLYLGWRPMRPPGLDDAADAIALLAHETEHLLNDVADEAEVECYAAQDVRALARELGASPAYASRLASTFWKYVYPKEERIYRTDECRNDGFYDKRPETSIFP